MASSAEVKRASASTNQPIFSTSPVQTATTSPAATWRVRTAPSSTVLRVSSCWTRAAALIQLVTAVRCSMVSPNAVSRPSSMITAPASASRVPERSTTACTAQPTAAGKEATAAMCRVPQAAAANCPRHCLTSSQSRRREPERASGSPGSEKGRLLRDGMMS